MDAAANPSVSVSQSVYLLEATMSADQQEQYETDVFIPPEYLYAVIEMVTEGEVYACVAPTNWLSNITEKIVGNKVIRKGVCAWPTDEKNLSAFTLKRASPGVVGIWKMHTVTILKYCRTYSQAKNAAATAVEKTDVDTDAEDVACKTTTRGRKVQGPKKFGGDVSSEDEYDDPGHNKSLTNKAKGKSSNHVDLPAPTIKNKLKMVTTASGPKSNGTSCQVNEVSIRKNGPTASTSAAAAGSHLVEETHEEVLVTPASSSSIQSAPPSSLGTVCRQLKFPANSPWKRSPNKPNTLGMISMRTFLREMQDVKSRISTLQVTCNKILMITNPVLDNPAAAMHNLPPMPIDSKEDLVKWHAFLEEGDNKLISIKFLADFGANTLKETCYCIMRKLMTNKLACSFNMCGQNRTASQKKDPFLNEPSYNIVIAAVKKHGRDVQANIPHFGFMEPAAKEHVATWLKDAPKRYKNEQEHIAKRMGAQNIDEIVDDPTPDSQN